MELQKEGPGMLESSPSLCVSFLVLPPSDGAFRATERALLQTLGTRLVLGPSGALWFSP